MNAPVVKTYINAIKKGWLATFLGLTVEAVQQLISKNNTNNNGTPAQGTTKRPIKNKINP